MNLASPKRLERPTAGAPEVRLVCTARVRHAGQLDLDLPEPPADPPVAAVVAAARRHPGAASWVLAGGEPTLRADFPQLIRALSDAGAPALGMVTDGLALASPKVPGMLRQLGLDRVRIRLASARHDAHDWVAGATGSWRRAIRALRHAAEAGLLVDVVVPVTRPTQPHLVEVVELVHRLGARGVVLRRVTGRGAAQADDVATLARLGLLQRELELAAQAGVRHGLRVLVEGFPRCAAPAAAAQRVQAGEVLWSLPDAEGWTWLAPHYEPPADERGCAGCPGPPECGGAPVDYLRRFGRTEIDSESTVRRHPGTLPPTPNAGGDTPPPPRAGRFPASRLAYARLGARLPSLGGDPLAPMVPEPVDDAVRIVFAAPSRPSDPALGDKPDPGRPESTRDIRVRLVQVAQLGAPTLRIASAGTLAHPDCASMLREATRLEFDHVEVAGEGSALDAVRDMDLRRLRGISRIDLALYAPDPAGHDAVVGVDGAFDATLRVLDRLGNLVPSLRIGCYAVLRDPAHLHDFAEAWDLGDLPGDPWFRLAPTGGSLTALAAAAEALPDGPAREAIAAVLPVRLFGRPDHVLPAPEATVAWGALASVHLKPSGSDRFGCYTERPGSPRQPAPGGCPGIAVGWTEDA